MRYLSWKTVFVKQEQCEISQGIDRDTAESFGEIVGQPLPLVHLVGITGQRC